MWQEFRLIDFVWEASRYEAPCGTEEDPGLRYVSIGVGPVFGLLCILINLHRGGTRVWITLFKQSVVSGVVAGPFSAVVRTRGKRG